MKYFLLLGVVLVCSATNIPDHYDLSSTWSLCHSFKAEDQGNCNSCAAMALASTLGIRTCIRDGRNVRFSPQRIWDCYGGSCDQGVLMQDFMYAIMYSTIKDLVMLVHSGDDVMMPSNRSKCIKHSTTRVDRVDTISYHKEWWISALIGIRGTQSIQLEIIENGPVIGILRLTKSEFDSFVLWKDKLDNDVFIPKNSLTEARDYLHAVTLIGWNVDNETKQFYWKILNSFGQQWGKNGTGNIPLGFGSVEREWYSVYSSPLACNASEELCIEPVVFQKNSLDDEIFTTLSIKAKKQNAMDDGEVLLFTALCMSFLAAIICSIHHPVKRHGVDRNPIFEHW